MLKIQRLWTCFQRQSKNLQPTYSE